MRVVTFLVAIVFTASVSTLAVAKAKHKAPKAAPAAKTETFEDLNASGIKLIRNLFMVK